MPAAATPSAGQVPALPSQLSATSHSPSAARQGVPAETGVHAPSAVAPELALQVSHAPVQGAEQHTPSAQKPDAQVQPFSQGAPIGSVPATARSTMRVRTWKEPEMSTKRS